MTKSPQRLFFIIGSILLTVGILMSFSITHLILFPNNQPPSYILDYARYLAKTGQLDAALREYEGIKESNLPDETKLLSEIEQAEILEMLIHRPMESTEATIINFFWMATPKLILGGLFALLLSLFFVFRRSFFKRPQIAILRVEYMGDESKDLVDLPRLMLLRAKELAWKFQNLSQSNKFLSETLELPTMGLLNDENSINLSEIVETAITISGSTANKPLSRMVSKINLWINCPKHYVQYRLGITDLGTLFQIYLFDGDTKELEKTWSIKFANNESQDLPLQISDSLLFILIQHFATKLSTRNWKALQALCYGLEILHDNSTESLNNSDIEKVENLLKRAIALDSSYYLSFYNLGLISLRKGDNSEARENFRQVMALSEDNTLKVYATYGYGTCLLQLNQEWAFRRALGIFLGLIEKSENDEIASLARAALALIYVKLAELDKEQRQRLLENARSEIEAVKSAESSSRESISIANSAEGYLYIQEGSMLSAISSFSQAIKDDPNNISALIGLGNVYLLENQTEQAINAFKTAKALSISGGYSGYKLGCIYQEMGDIDKAVEAFKGSLSFSLSSLALGKIYLKKKEYNLALELFRRCVNQNKKMSDGWGNIAWTICEMNTNDTLLIKECEDSARRALELEHDPTQLWHRHCVFSRALLLSSKLSKAADEAKKAVEISHNPQAYYYLAIIEKKIGNKEEAKNAGVQILKLGDKEWRQKIKNLGVFEE